MVFPNAHSAYLHIPFCRRRCYYCDFPISIVGDRPPLARQTGRHTYGTIAEYVDWLCQEIAATPFATQSNQPQLETIFLGGGTPSLLTVEQVDRLLTQLDHRFGIASQAEISMEIDPDTIDRAQLQGYATAGINRVSLGVQAFQLEVLAACGRTHTPEDIDRAVEWLHQVGVSNVSFDLISGLPHLTLERWQDSLDRALALAPAHLSIYDLTVEPGTAFDRWYQPGVAPLPTDDLTTAMYRRARDVLTQAGYQHYEISNYARSGFQCRHNRVYWENRAYYGFGMGAASYLKGQRFTRPRQRHPYYEWVQEFVATGGAIDWAVTSPVEEFLDRLMLGLRLVEGIALLPLTAEVGRDRVTHLLEILEPFQTRGWVERVTNPEPAIRLTDPEGFLFSNQVLSTVFAAIEDDEEQETEEEAPAGRQQRAVRAIAPDEGLRQAVQDVSQTSLGTSTRSELA